MNHQGTKGTKGKARKGVSRTRPSIERLVFLARALRLGQLVNTRVMAEKLEVDRKTVTRDLDFLRDRLRYDFDWVQPELSFRLRNAPEAAL